MALQLAQEDAFLKYNKRNIIGDLYAAEVHLRYATQNMAKEHMGCVAKHLLHVRNELGEAISHTKKEDERKAFREGLYEVEKLLDKFEEGKLTLDDVRKLRKMLEKYTPYGTSECRLCALLTQPYNTVENYRIVTDNISEGRVINMAEQVGLPSISEVLDPLFEPASRLTGIPASDLSTYVGIPVLAGITYYGLGHLLTPLGKKVMALLGSLGGLAAVYFGLVEGRARTDSLVFTAVSIATLFDPTNDKDLLENLEALKRGDVIGAFVNMQAVETLVTDLDEAISKLREETEEEEKAEEKEIEQEEKEKDFVKSDEYRAVGLTEGVVRIYG